jgi:hypothetical protein
MTTPFVGFRRRLPPYLGNPSHSTGFASYAPVYALRLTVVLAMS